MHKLWVRIRDSKALFDCVTWIIGTYVNFAFRTTKWQRIGFEALADTVATQGPVIVVCWHQRLINAPLSWDDAQGTVATLISKSRAGKIASGVQVRLGMIPINMHDDASNLSSSLKVAKMVKSGVTLGITADGPEGPARICNGAVLEWARLTSKPIYLFTYATKGHWLLDTWDKMMVPRPFTKGVMMYQRWDGEVPRKPTETQMQELAAKMTRDLDQMTAEADQLSGER